jgi:4-amino-4-deoxy-L-arabinose transferase-like glycosyltransferase
MRPAVAGWPGAGRAALVLLLILSLARLAAAALTPLSPDEAYYWVWSRALAGGYPDHPPMVALWIRAGCWLAGDNPLGVRLLGPVAAALGSVLLAQAGEDLLPGRNAGLVAAALMNATLLFGIGAVTMTPDTPLLFFWTAALWALGRLLATGRPGWWLVAGLATGLALDSKYTAALLPAGVLVWVVAVPSLRPWLRRPWPWLAAGLALLLFTPVLAWNAGHGWISFAKQGARTGDWQPGRALQFVGELLGGQIGLATPVLAVLFGAGLVVALRNGLRREPGWTLLVALTILPALVFLEHALGDRVQANWPSVMYPATAIAAAGLGGRWTALRKPGIALGLGLTLLVWVQGAAAPLPLPMQADPTLMRVGGWDGLAADVEAARRRVGADFVVSENYGHSAMLALLMPADVPVLGADARWALFDLPDARPEVIGRVGLLLRSARLDDRPDMADWSEITPLGEVTRSRGGMTAEVFRLYRVVGRVGNVPIAKMPRPR